MKEFWKELDLLEKIAVITLLIFIIVAHVVTVWALIDINLLVPKVWVRAIMLIIYTLLIVMDSMIVISIIFNKGGIK